METQSLLTAASCAITSRPIVTTLVGNIMQMIHHVGSNIDAPGLVNWNRRYQTPSIATACLPPVSPAILLTCQITQIRPVIMHNTATMSTAT